MSIATPIIVLICLIIGTVVIVANYYDSRPPIRGAKDHVPMTRLPNDLFTEPVKFCKDCGETDLTGNCFPKLFFTNCDIIVRWNGDNSKNELYCRTHFRESNNSYQCACSYPAGLKLSDVIARSIDK